MATPDESSIIYENELNIESLISAPLIAASKANAFMLKGQYRYLLDNCFYKIIDESEDEKKLRLQSAKVREEKIKSETEEEKTERLRSEEQEKMEHEKKIRYEPIMIKMSYTRSEIKQSSEKMDFETKELTFSVPVLCLIPFSSLAIDNLKVDFDMEITSVTSYRSTHGVIDNQAQLHGHITSSPAGNGTIDSKNKSNSRLKVNINASKLPLPTGLLSIIELYNKAIQPVSVKQPEPPQKTDIQKRSPKNKK